MRGVEKSLLCTQNPEIQNHGISDYSAYKTVTLHLVDRETEPWRRSVYKDAWLFC